MINFIFGFIVGLIIGGLVGVSLMCILQIAKDDEEWKYIYTERRIKNRNLKKREYQYLLKARIKFHYLW